MKLVSIVLTTLNGARHIRQAIDSCLAQTYPRLELIVVDGGSTDGTIEIVQTYQDSRVRLIHQPDNVGRLPGAINLGLRHAKGEYLTWTQDDSYYEPNAIAVLADYLDTHPQTALVYAAYWERDEIKGVTRLVDDAYPEHLVDKDVVRYCFLLRRTVRETVGEHRLDMYPIQDDEYWLRIARAQFRIDYVPLPLYTYRVHSQSLTGRLGWPTLARKSLQLRYDMGILTGSAYRARRSEVEIADAFENYARRNWQEVISRVVAGIWYNPAWLRNRGVVSILVRSLGNALTERLYLRMVW